MRLFNARFFIAIAVYMAASGLACYVWPESKTDTVPSTAIKASDSTPPSSQAASDTAVRKDTVKANTKADIDFKKIGDQYARQGQTEKAMAAYKQWIDNTPADTAKMRTAAMLGQYFYVKKEYNDAARYFSMAKGKNSDPSFLVTLGRSLYYAGKFKEALGVLEPLSGNPKLKIEVRRDVLKTIGDAYGKADQANKAIAWYGKYLKLGGANNADIAFAIALSQEGAPIKAKQRFEENIKKFPTDYRNYLHLSILLSKNKAALQRSAALLKKASALAVTPAASLEIARIYGRMGKTEEELKACQTCLRTDTFNIEARTRIGTILLKKGETAGALNLLEETHAKFPDSVGPMAALAAAYLKTGKAKDAIDLLVKTKAVKPKDAAVRRQLFEAYYATGQDSLALVEIKAALDLKRDNESLLSYGKLLAKMGKPDEAANVMEDIRATAPDNIEALMTLAMIYRGQKKLNEAIELYKEINSIDGKYTLALYERAEVYLAQNKIKWAEQFYKRTLEANPKMGLAELGLAKLALIYKNRTAYLEHIDKAQALDPENPMIKQELENSRNSK